MRSILNNGGSCLELNALFIQPTRWCGLNCAGCYVKNHSESTYQVSLDTLTELFRIFYKGKLAWANQITISIDNKPKDNMNAYFMNELYKDIITLIENDTRSKLDKPEVHFTYHDVNTYMSYAENSSISSAANALSMISFSNIKIEDILFINTLEQYAEINYNHLVPWNVSSQNIDKYVEKMIAIGESVNSIYLVINKRPIHDKLVAIGDANRMRQDIIYINTMLKRLPERIRNKVHVDGCLEDVIKYKKTGYGCSSNVSRIQVWPDGSVSGCAYALNGTAIKDIGYSATTAEIMENIRDAKTRYEFKTHCHLPEVYDSVLRNDRYSSTKMETWE